MENLIAELQKEIESLKEKLRFTEEILEKAPCFIYINEMYTSINILLTFPAILRKKLLL
jgi:peptidoglycan hydrolase CwlO-like protein